MSRFFKRKPRFDIYTGEPLEPAVRHGMINEYRKAWRAFRGWRARWQVLTWIGVIFGGLMLIGAIGGSDQTQTAAAGTTHPATKVTPAPMTEPATTTETEPEVPAPPSQYEVQSGIETALASMPRFSKHGTVTVRCWSASTASSYACRAEYEGKVKTKIAKGKITVKAEFHASRPDQVGMARRILAKKLANHIRRIRHADAKAVAKHKAAEARRRAAERRENQKTNYCLDIFEGLHMGLSETTVHYYCGYPGDTQRMSGYGVVTDYWYYDSSLFGFFGDEYQLVFDNGVLDAVNQY